MMEDISLVTESPRKSGWVNINTKRIIVFGFIFIAAAALVTLIVVLAIRHQKPPAPTKHKNLILMIGDGYGPAAVTMGRTCKGSDLNIEKYLTGMIRTRSSESLVTDSAAGATAYACGLRTFNQAIAVDDHIKPCGTIFEAAKAKGMLTGAVVTSRVTHATPAAFTSHAYDRYDEEFIAKQQVEQGLEVFMGGGRDYFLNTTRSDHYDLIQKFKEMGYAVLLTESDFQEYTGNGPVVGLFAASHMSYDIDRVRFTNTSSSAAQPSLADMTRKALSILSSRAGDRGFMLLVEGSRIDHAGHDNDPAAHVRDILAFDEAARVCIEFAENSDNTLLVATADHETGGMTLALQAALNETAEYVWYPDVILRVNASAEWMVTEIKKNNRTIRDVVTQYALPDLADSELAYIQSNTASSDLLRWSIGKVVADRAHVGWTTHGHSGVDVDLYAFSSSNIPVPTGSVENYELGLFLKNTFELDLLSITEKLKDFNPFPNSTEVSKRQRDGIYY